MFDDFEYILLSVLIIILIFTLSSCKTIETCPDNLAFGNAGSALNFINDDYKTVVYQDYLFFASTNERKSKQEEFYRSKINKGIFQIPVLYSALPYKNFIDYSSPSFFREDNIKKVVFSGISPKDKTGNHDIFISEFKSGQWSKPHKLDSNINTKYYESSPSISSDGKVLVFVSDRPGGIGETDIYVTYLSKKGTWGKAKNLGDKINTPQKEITPFIDDKGNLYYSSLGFSESQGMDIIRVRKEKSNEWIKPQLLNFPINTDANEISPTIWNNQIILSSDRQGGCGGFDIYKFDLCGTVGLNLTIKSEDRNIPLDGKVLIVKSELDSMNFAIGGNGVLKIPLKIDEYYYLKYQNNCLPNNTFEKSFETFCSDTSTVLMNLAFQLKAKKRKFSFKKYNVPFFVTGYYLPLTKENLNSLRLNFAYNIIGVDNSTAYIENPGEKYNVYADTVEKALSNAIEFVKNQLSYFDGDCTKGNEKIKIRIIGYADSRALSVYAKYVGPDVSDDKMDLKISTGDNINNQKLSQLRAYFTAEYIKQKLNNFALYDKYKNRIEYETYGAGVDKSYDSANEFNRRVDISISLIE